MAAIVFIGSGPARSATLAVGDRELAVTFTGTAPISALVGSAVIDPVEQRHAHFLRGCFLLGN